MRPSRNTPGINTGSTADIAFLLLIFFLVSTTIPNDKGIIRQLPRPCLTPPCNEPILERNLLQINLNKQGALLVNNNSTSMTELKEVLKQFIDNNGQGNCEYCFGNRLANASDHPQKAVISLSSDRASSDKVFIA